MIIIFVVSDEPVLTDLMTRHKSVLKSFSSMSYNLHNCWFNL